MNRRLNRVALCIAVVLICGCSNQFAFTQSPVSAMNQSSDQNVSGLIEIKGRSVPVDFNQPVEFQLGSEPGEWVFRLSGTERSQMRARFESGDEENGVIEIVDLEQHRFRFRPRRGFRGEIERRVRVVVEGANIQSNEAIIRFLVGSSIHTLKPALAVRATGCLMCHANVESNVITDFGWGGDGKGNDYFFGRGFSSPFAGSIYGNHGAGGENWLTASVTGEVIVPQVDLPNWTGLGGTLAQYLASMQANRPKTQIREVNQVRIGAPTADEFLEAAGDMPADHPSWKYIPDSTRSAPIGTVTDRGAYLEIVGGAPFACAGDLVVKKPLVIRNGFRLQTDDSGCRIYAAATIFLQGNVTYLGNAPNRNLQLLSSRAILVGLGKSTVGPIQNGISDSIQLRFTYWTSPGYFKRGGTPSEQNQAILRDAQVVDGLLDAASLPEGRAVGLERILMVAPQVDSRFQGNVQGTVIAEVALFSLNSFRFTYDEVFTRANILPLVKAENYLSVSASE